jgi:RNA polymerase sigma factor (TIGR02999 family)
MTAMKTPEEPTAALLRSIREGAGGSSEQLFDALYDELHRLAQRVRQGRASDTMSTTALVHEAYIKLVSAESLEPESRLHFFRIAARAMRQILVDAARGKLAGKRGGDLFPVTFEDALHHGPLPAARLLSLDLAIDRLAEVDPRAAQVVECRYFAGLTIEETAAALDIAPRTVKRDWRIARALLSAELTGTEG